MEKENESPGKHRWVLRAVSFALLLLLLVVWCNVEQAPTVAYPHWLQENFSQPASRCRWQITRDWRTRGISLETSGERPGIHVRARTTSSCQSPNDFAVADWPVDDRSFNLKFDVTVKTELQKYFEAGLAVALCSQPPSLMEADDLCVVVQVSYAGIGMAVWRGWFLSPEATQISQTTHDVDGLESVPWHMQFISDPRLSFNIARDNDVIRFDVSSSSLPELSLWHSEQYQLSSDENLHVRHIVVQRVPVKQKHVGYPNFNFDGRVTGFEGYCKDSPPPRITDVRSRDHSSIQIAGSGLQMLDHIRHGTDTPVIRSSSPTSIEAQLTDSDSPLMLRFASDNMTWTEQLPSPSAVRIGSLTPREISRHGELVRLKGSQLHKVNIVTIGGSRVAIVSRDEQAITFRAPKLKPGRHAVTLTTDNGATVRGLDLLVGRHPRLFWTDTSLIDRRRRLQSAEFDGYRAAIYKEARGGNLLAQTVLTAVQQDEGFRKTLLASVRSICRQRKAIEFDAITWGMVAAVYDCLFDSLSAEDRDLLLGYLEFTLECYRRTDADWFFNTQGNPSNTVAISNSGGGLVALVLLDTHPQARRLAERARRKLREFAQATIRPDGGYIEGTLYWNFAMAEYVRFMLAWENSRLPSTSPVVPALRSMPDYVNAVFDNDGYVLAFNDSQPLKTGLPVVAYLSRRYGHRRMGRLADHYINQGYPNSALTFLVRDSSPVNNNLPEAPGVILLPQTQLATFRSQTPAQPQSTLAIYGGSAPMSHHRQQDQGSVFYSVNGDWLLIDPGYFLPEAKHHSIPLINGAGPTAGISSRFTAFASHDNCSFLRMDLSDAYAAHPTSQDVQSVVRHILFHSGEFVIVDEVVTESGSFDLQQQFQFACPVEYSRNSNSVDLSVPQRKGVPATLSVAGRQWSVTIDGPRDFDGSWEFRKFAEAGTLSWHSVKLSRRQPSGSPSVWTLSLAEAPLKIEVGNDKIAGVFSDGLRFTIRKDSEGWIWDDAAPRG
ncbi:MAG: IPT/TIG domain-containing protein [Planctomycetaceae bacterium]|nr:IPT/TIG domain-containing protein [Planctomycetaceae bacterium]